MAKENTLTLGRRIFVVLVFRRESTQVRFRWPLDYDATIMDVNHDLRIPNVGREGLSLLEIVDLTLAMYLDTIPTRTCDFDTVTLETRTGRLVACFDVDSGYQTV